MAEPGLWIIFVVSVQLFSWITFAASPPPPPVYTCTQSKQSHEIDANIPGQIVSPTGDTPDKYPDNQDCSWKLTAPHGKVIRIRITLLDLEQGDSLMISDGDQAHGGNLIGKYSLCMKGTLSLFSTGMAMFIQFKSDDQETERGFEIEYKTVRRDKIVTEAKKVNNICTFRSVVRDPSGYIASPGFPNSLQVPIECTWQAVPKADRPLYLSYKMIGLVPKNIPGPSGVCTDFVLHLYYKRRTEMQSEKYCGCELPPNAKGPAGYDAYINMKSGTGGKTYNQPGFLIYHKSMDTSSCADPNTCPALDDDRDVGFDKHANIKYEKKEITTPPPTTRPFAPPTEEPLGPFSVNCYKDEMKVALNFTRFPLLEEDSATLRDPKCQLYRRDDDHVYLKTPLDGCGTYHNYSSDGRYIIYYNQIMIRPAAKPGDLITRDHDAVFEFECRYHRRVVMSVVHYSPSRADVYTTTENIGNFTFMMRMFKSDQYKTPYDSYPVYVAASKEIYIQTEVKAKDAELVLNIDKCVVTPSTDPNDKEFYNLIEKSCPVDETLAYHHKLSAVQRFNFKAFYFNVDKEATVHIHCTVRVCRKADENSRCVKGCSYSRRRRAADAKEEDEITGSLSIGPLQLEESKTGKVSNNSPKMFVEIVVGVLGFFVAVLLLAVTVVLFKKRPQAKKGFLVVQDNEQ